MNVQTEQIKSPRGPYRVLSSGELPKRDSKASIEKLVKKSAQRGHDLELSRKTNARQTKKIKEMEKELGAVRKNYKDVEEQAQRSESLVFALQREIAELQESVEKKPTLPMPTGKKKSL
jgi:septal ring factor EnvC (AmiA/AmiB activator)